MVSLAGFKARYCQRVIRDLPADLEAMKCEDPLGLLRHHVPRLIDGIERHTGTRQPAYARRAVFGIPGSPPYSRLRSAEGYTTFHFAKNVVDGRTARAFDDYARGKEREAALEQDAGRVQEIEAGIDGALKDAYMRGHGGQGGGPADGWTNLHDPSDWDTIETFERDRRVNPDGNPPGVSIFYNRTPLLFDALAADAACPTNLRKVIGKEQARASADRPLSERKIRDGVRWTDERAFDTYAWMKSHPLWPKQSDRGSRPARVSEGRAVQTHLAGEGEYHADLGSAARARIRAGMIELVQSQRNPASMDDDGWFLPMTICDHAASSLNDPLNDHFHWLIGTRRARYGENSDLEFEPTKVNAITRDGWIDVMREELARLTNIELAAVGADVRYHPGTLAEMGIDAVAQQKMHGRRTVLERAGVSTARGLSNDAEGWRRAFAAVAHEHDAALAGIDRDLSAADLQYDTARAARIAAARLRHEAAQIQILTDMSRSRADRTMRFAPEYAADASTPRVALGWRARADEAERYLAALDADLTAERDGIAERLTRATLLEAEATALITAPGRQKPVKSADRPTSMEVADPHRAVDIIARAPLFIEHADGRLFVHSRDDPDGLVTDVDLSRVQRRLAGIRASQQRELAQVQAFARRHGADALFDDACETHSAWFRDAARKWRDAPAMQRYLGEREAQVIADRERDARERHVSHLRQVDRSLNIKDATDLPSLADMPYLGDLTEVTERGAAPISQPVISPAQVSVPLYPARTAEQQPPAMLWSELERRHRDLLAWQEKRDRQRTMQAIAEAFADRVGSRHAITPYAERLIAKMVAGFDPATVAAKIGLNGRNLDQRDAEEIGVLMWHNAFPTEVEAARRQAASTPGAILTRPSITTGPDFLGRVGLRRDRLYFGPASQGDAGPICTPLEWAEQTVALVLERQMPLTRQDGLVGIHDPVVLRLSRYNYLGLLHPSIQYALDAQRRIQVEEERGILAKVRTGEFQIDATIERDRTSNDVRTRVTLVSGPADAQAFVSRRQSDAAFYFRCREALAGIPPEVPPLRSEHAAVRAWLSARDEGAAEPVLDLLGQAVRKVAARPPTDGMTEADTIALLRLLTPPVTTNPGRVSRRGRLRHHLPKQPGHSGPSR